MLLLTADEVYSLLANLCVELGFCLPPDAIARLEANPPADVDSFTEAVFIAEGFDPQFADRRLWAQVREMVQDGFDRAAATD